MNNNPRELSQWIDNPQHIKPGTRMPQLGLRLDDLRDLVAYLESRK